MNSYALIDAGSTTTRHTRVDYSGNRFIEYGIQTYPSAIEPVPYTGVGFVMNGQSYCVARKLPFLDTTSNDIVRKYSELGKLQIGKALYDFGFSLDTHPKIIYAVASNLKYSERKKIKTALVGTYEISNKDTFELTTDDIQVVTQGDSIHYQYFNKVLIQNQPVSKVGIYYDVGMFTTDVTSYASSNAYAYNARGILLGVGGTTNNAFSRAGFTTTFEHIHDPSAVKKDTTGYLKIETQKFIDDRLAPIHSYRAAEIEENPYNCPMIIGGGFGALLLLHKVKGLKLFDGAGILEIQDGRLQVIEAMVSRLIDEGLKRKQ